MMDVGTMLSALAEPFPREAIKRRQGGGGMSFDYVETHTVIHRLNAAVGVWSFAVKSFEFRDDGKMCVVVGELTIPGLGTRSGIGVQALQARGGEDLIKGAASDALKKAATLFGVALHLYGPDYEGEELVSTDKRSAPRPPVGRSYNGKKVSGEEMTRTEVERHTGQARGVTEDSEEDSGPFAEPDTDISAARMKEWKKFAAVCKAKGFGNTQEEWLNVFRALNPDARKEGYKATPEEIAEIRETVEESPQETIEESVGIYLLKVNNMGSMKTKQEKTVDDAESRKAALSVLRQTMVKFGLGDDKATRTALYKKILGKDTPDTAQEMLNVAAKLRQTYEKKS